MPTSPTPAPAYPGLSFLGVSGSLRTGSLNTAVIRTAVRMCDGTRCSMTAYSSIGQLPFFAAAVEIDNPPPEVARWRAAVGAADAVLIACPEYAHGMSGVLKNAFEWAVGSGEFVGKPVGVVTASPSRAGGGRAQAWIRETLEVMGARVVAESLTIPLAGTKIVVDHVVDTTVLYRLEALLESMGAMARNPDEETHLGSARRHGGPGNASTRTRLA